VHPVSPNGGRRAEILLGQSSGVHITLECIRAIGAPSLRNVFELRFNDSVYGVREALVNSKAFIYLKNDSLIFGKLKNNFHLPRNDFS
jgi:hypothetical protein